MSTRSLLLALLLCLWLTAQRAQATNPSGVGHATPFLVGERDKTLITVEVTPGTNPPSTGITVFVDLGPLGGSTQQYLLDDGTHGDDIANDNIFTWSFVIPCGTPEGFYSVNFTITDAQDRLGSGATLIIVGSPPPPCSPCDLNHDGKLGYEDELAFLCQLSGGDCCGCGDFDGDLNCGTDADIEAFFLCMEDPASLCGRADNDFCDDATDLFSNLGVFAFDTTYASGSPGYTPTPTLPLMWGAVWFKWHAVLGIATTVSVDPSFPTPTAIAVYTTPCPVSPSQLVVFNEGPVVFTPAAGANYLIRIGGRGHNTDPPTGGPGLFSIVQVSCPRTFLLTFSKLYELTGPGNGLNWSWRITAPAFNPLIDIEHQDVTGVSGTTLSVAQAFAASVNDIGARLSCPTSRLQAKAASVTIGTTKHVFLAISAKGPFALNVGAGRDHAACPVLTTLPACMFNPDILEQPISGLDCNHNGWDDTIDIAFGDSADLNQNGVPDECECGTADFNHDGDIGTDADIEAFFACLGGNCCASCGSADFNGDGDLGTDADIEAFFRVLGGGSC